MRIPFLLLFLATYITCYSQLSPTTDKVIHPEYSTKSLTIEVSKNQIDELVYLQEKSNRENVVFPVGKLIPVEIDFMQQAEWSYDIFENRIGKLKIYSSGATGLSVYFSEFFLPIGSKFYAYNPSHSEVIGPYSFVDNPTENGFGSGTINGEYLILEVFIPKGTKSLPQLKIEQVGYELNPKKIDQKANRDFGDSDDCQVNVKCDEGASWAYEKNAVVRIKMVFGGFEGWCTGTIMNNTFQDCTPYVLTADHCRHLKGGIVAKDSEYANWEFYFNYESDKCKNPNSEGDVTIAKLTGCSRKASAENGGDGDPDFLLLRLNDVIPQFYNPHFAGWDNRNIPSNHGVMIHHPAGDIKKISTYTRQVESSEWNSTLTKDSHWKLIWAKTTNGFGGSEGGSSGSALWNQDKRVVGQLTGGSSACKEGNGTGPFNPDYFGKLHVAYALSQDTTKSLEYWLDRGRSLVNTIDGINWPCSELPLAKKEITYKVFNIKIFPNPASQEVTFSFENNEEKILVIYDVLGNEIFNETLVESEYKLNVSSWEKGIYLINCLGAKTHKTQKLIIE